MAPWWGAQPDLEAEYGASIDGKEPSRCFVVHLNGEPIGLIQTYWWRDWPNEAARVVARDDEAGIDYMIGDPSLIGRGIGPKAIRAFLDEVLDGPPTRVNVAVANRRSWRCLEKLGFRRDPEPRMIEGESGPQYVLSYRSSRAR